MRKAILWRSGKLLARAFLPGVQKMPIDVNTQDSSHAVGGMWHPMAAGWGYRSARKRSPIQSLEPQSHQSVVRLTVGQPLWPPFAPQTTDVHRQSAIC